MTKIDIEYKLREIWFELTSKDVSESSSFSSLGAGSMANLILKKKIFDTFNIELKVSELFKNSSFSSQVDLLTEKLKQESSSAKHENSLQGAEKLLNLDRLQEFCKKFGLPGANVSVYKSGQVAHKAWGMDDIENDLALTPKHQYRIYCIGKALVAYAALKLVDQGKVELEQPIIKWIPELFKRDINADQQITLRMLLSHSSGLDETVVNPIIHSTDDLAQAIDRIGRLKQIAKPGELFIYSTASYLIISHLIEKLTGEDIHTAIDNLVFKPLGIEEALTPSNIAKGYAKGGSEAELTEIEPSTIKTLKKHIEIVASSKIALTSESLLKLAVIPVLEGKTLDGRSYLNPQLAAELVKQHISVEGHFYLTGWSLGWFGFADEGIYGFLSGINGHQSVIVIDAKGQQAMVAQTNTSLNHEFFDYLSKEFLDVSLLKSNLDFAEFPLSSCYGDYKADGFEVSILPDGDKVKLVVRHILADGSWSDFREGNMIPSGRGDFMVQPKTPPMHGSLSFHDFEQAQTVTHLRLSQQLCKKVNLETQAR